MKYYFITYDIPFLTYKIKTVVDYASAITINKYIIYYNVSKRRYYCGQNMYEIIILTYKQYDICDRVGKGTSDGPRQLIG